MEALTPPAQLSEWHLLNIAAYRTAQALVDIQPKDDVVDFASSFLIAVESAVIEELREAAARVPRDVRQRMIEADCIDSDVVPDDYADVPDDHADSEVSATAIRVGAGVRGALDYDGDIDYFRFQAEQGEFYQIDVALGTLDDSIVNLYDGDGWFLDTNDDYGDTYASRLSWEAPSSGERYVAVEGYGVGTYTLTVSHSTIVDDHGDDIDDATAIRVGADVRGALDYDGDIDFFRFQAEQGQSYRIDVAQGTLYDPKLDLFDSDGWLLGTNDDYGDTYASRLYWEAPSSGERYVAVKGGTGTYTLTVSLDDHGNDFESATLIAIRETVAIELENNEDIDVLVFRARPGTEYVLSLNWESYSFRQSYTARPLLAVFDTDGTEHTRLMGYDFSRISVPSIDLQWQAVTGGDYYIVIGDGNTDGIAAFSVTGGEATEPIATPTAAPRATSTPRPTPAPTTAPTDTPTPEPTPAPTATPTPEPTATPTLMTSDGATTAAVGVDVEGVIDYEGDSDYFRFTAEEGQLYQIDVALGTLDDSELTLRDSDGWRLGSNDDHGDSSASRIVWRAPDGGEYFLVVEGWWWDHDVGSYTLTVAYSDIADATTAALGVGVEGVIDYEGDSDYFRFTAEEGQLYQIDVALGTLDDSELTLRDSDGWSLESDHGDSSASRIVWRAPDAGEYFLVVEGWWWNHDVGSYTLTVAYSDIADDHGSGGSGR